VTWATEARLRGRTRPDKAYGGGSTTGSNLSGLLLTDVGDSSVGSEAEALPPYCCLLASAHARPPICDGRKCAGSHVKGAACCRYRLEASCLLTVYCHLWALPRVHKDVCTKRRQVDGERKIGRTRGSERGSDTITQHAAQPAPAISSTGFQEHARSMRETGTRVFGVTVAVQFVKPA
jgi:hypothetical protein